VQSHTVVVVVGDNQAKVQFCTIQSSLRSHILEDAVALFAQKTVDVRGRRIGKRRKFRAVGEELVHEAIIVAINGSHASAHGLREVLPACIVVVQSKGKMRAVRDVREPE
jgi:hypothetical protein